MSNVKIIFPTWAYTTEKKLIWAREELGNLYLERERLWAWKRATQDYDKVVGQLQTSQARVAELLRELDNYKKL